MKLFSCSVCQQVLFFENVACTQCGHALAYLPDRTLVSALEPAGDDHFVALGAGGARYRLCKNYVDHAACNWAVPAADPEPLCLACRCNDVIPNLGDAHALDAWRRLERAKRRLFYTLAGLGLPLQTRAQHPRGLAFSFMQDQGGQKVFTGHSDGLITINIAEADDPFREKMRLQMGEAYRTVLGHFRHEIGHYYWQRLVEGTEAMGAFRDRFGDERADYGAALERHYKQGAPPDWSQKFVSAYASMHPFEDWAETWAHYLHMVETLETARSYGLALRPQPVGGAPLGEVRARRLDFDDFDDLIGAWVPLTLAMNSLNRAMGHADQYPFVLSAPAVAKLRFVHDVVERAAARPAGPTDGRSVLPPRGPTVGRSA